MSSAKDALDFEKRCCQSILSATTDGTAGLLAANDGGGQGKVPGGRKGNLLDEMPLGIGLVQSACKFGLFASGLSKGSCWSTYLQEACSSEISMHLAAALDIVGGHCVANRRIIRRYCYSWLVEHGFHSGSKRTGQQ